MTSSKHYYPHFAGLLADIAQEHQCQFELLSKGWVKRLAHGDQVSYIWGYYWDLNPSVAQLICADKFATHEVLTREGVPHVPHELFLRPAGNAPRSVESPMVDYAETVGFPLVIKPVRGFGGDEVYFLGDLPRLREIAARLFHYHEALTLSPYLPAPREIRSVVLDGEILLCYAKERPTVSGNGTDPLGRLIADQLPHWQTQLSEEFLAHQQPAGAATVPASGERVVVDFRHNLAQGALPRVLEPAQRPAILESLVGAAVAALGLRFCSVDCLVPDRGEPTIMEINAGVIIERFIDLHPRGRDLARQVYRRAFQALFDI